LKKLLLKDFVKIHFMTQIRPLKTAIFLATLTHIMYLRQKMIY